MGQKIKKVKEFLKTNIRILMPLTIVAMAVILFTGHIPYVNQYAQEFILIVLVMEWFILKRFISISNLLAIKIALLLFCASFLFTLVGLGSYSEVLGNFIFALLVINVVPLLLNKQS